LSRLAAASTKGNTAAGGTSPQRGSTTQSSGAVSCDGAARRPPISSVPRKNRSSRTMCVARSTTSRRGSANSSSVQRSTSRWVCSLVGSAALNTTEMGVSSSVVTVCGMATGMSFTG